MSDDIAKGLNYFIGLFLFAPYFKNSTLDAYIIFLYILFVIIVIMVLSILYIAYAYYKSNVPYTLPINIIRTIIYFWITILFLPIVDYLASIWNCDNNQHVYFPSLKCWTGFHIIYAISAFFAIVIFVTMCFVITMIFYDCRMNSSDSTYQNNPALIHATISIWRPLDLLVDLVANHLISYSETS